MVKKVSQKPTGGEKQYSATELRANIYQILDEALLTGEEAAIYRNGEILRIVPPKKRKKKLSKLANLPKFDLIDGDPEDIVHMDWSIYWNSKLP